MNDKSHCKGFYLNIEKNWMKCRRKEVEKLTLIWIVTGTIAYYVKSVVNGVSYLYLFVRFYFSYLARKKMCIHCSLQHWIGYSKHLHGHHWMYTMLIINCILLLPPPPYILPSFSLLLLYYFIIRFNFILFYLFFFSSLSSIVSFMCTKWEFIQRAKQQSFKTQIAFIIALLI